MQALLADRFALKFHRATKYLPMYRLVRAKSGSKLKESMADSTHSLEFRPGDPLARISGALVWNRRKRRSVLVAMVRHQWRGTPRAAQPHGCKENQKTHKEKQQSC